jgi:hypothetical protein
MEKYYSTRINVELDPPFSYWSLAGSHSSAIQLTCSPQQIIEYVHLAVQRIYAIYYSYSSLVLLLEANISFLSLHMHLPNYAALNKKENIE